MAAAAKNGKVYKNNAKSTTKLPYLIMKIDLKDVNKAGIPDENDKDNEGNGLDSDSKELNHELNKSPFMPMMDVIAERRNRR